MAETKDRLDEAMDFFLEKAKGTTDPEMKKLYIDGAVKFANASIECEKNEKLQYLEQKKYEESKDWKDPKFLIPIIVPGITMLLGRMYDRRTLWKQTVAICNFEKTNTFTTQAGKGLGSALRALPILNRGDHY